MTDTTLSPASPDLLNPVGHAVLAFATDSALQQTLRHLLAHGFDAAQVTALSPAQMVQRLDLALSHSSPLAGFGQEVNLARAHREMAIAGNSFLVVGVADDAVAERVAAAACDHGALSAHWYGRFVITELTAHPADTTAADILAQRKLDLPDPGAGSA